jgi:hypothetical protein
MTSLSEASKYFPGQPDPGAAAASVTRIRDAERADLISRGINPDDVLVSVRLQPEGQYLDARTGCLTTVLREDQYVRLEKQNADDERETCLRSATADEAAADNQREQIAAHDEKIAALTAERDASDDPGRRTYLGRQVLGLETARDNLAADEARNRQAAKDAKAAAKVVKVVPIYRPVVWVLQREIDAENKRRADKVAGVSPSPFPYRPAPGSDEAVGIKPRDK